MTKTQEYVIWLRGFLEGTGSELSETQATKIREKLNDIFEHVAEQPKLSLQELGEKHDFPVYEGFPPKDWRIGDTGPNGEVYRC